MEQQQHTKPSVKRKSTQPKAKRHTELLAKKTQNHLHKKRETSAKTCKKTKNS